jgi:hypothetical protein
VQQRRRVGRVVAAACAGLVLVVTGGGVAVAGFTGRATATMAVNTSFSAPTNLKAPCSSKGIVNVSWTATERATGYIGSLYQNKQLISTKVLGATTSYSFSASGTYTLSLVATYTLQGRSVATWTSAPATATFTC